MTDQTCTARSRERQPEDDGDVTEGVRAATADGEATGVSTEERRDDSIDDESAADTGGDGSADDSIGTESVGDESDDPDGDVRSHLRDVPVGSGCTEIWEHLAEHREDDE